jgi:peptidoglycan biosynthesis protein MviN/MurJ (putative lipid II flippase)
MFKVQRIRALRFILPAMPMFCVTELFSRVFDAKNLPSIPMYAAIGGIAANIAVGATLTFGGFFDIGAVGAANAAGQLTSAVILIVFAAKRIKGLFSADFIVTVVKLVLGGVLVFLTCILMSSLIGSLPYESGFFKNVINAFVIFVPSAVLYLGFMRLLRVKL